MRTVAVACLALLAVGLLGCLLTRSRVWGGVLMAAAVAWLPLNNGQLEGPVLIRLATDHGLTLADVAGVSALLVGALQVWPVRRWRSATWLAARAGVVVALLALGFGAAWTSTVERHDVRAAAHGVHGAHQGVVAHDVHDGRAHHSQ